MYREKVGLRQALRRPHLLGCFEKFDSFLFPALLQTQQAMLQQGIRDQIVVILNLGLAGSNAGNETRQCGQRDLCSVVKTHNIHYNIIKYIEIDSKD